MVFFLFCLWPLKMASQQLIYTGQILSCQSILSPCFKAIALFLHLHFPLTHMDHMLSSSCPPWAPSTYISRHYLNSPHFYLANCSSNCRSAAGTHLPCYLFCRTKNTTMWPAVLLQHLICCKLWEGAMYMLIRRLLWLSELLLLYWWADNLHQLVGMYPGCPAHSLSCLLANELWIT